MRWYLESTDRKRSTVGRGGMRLPEKDENDCARQRGACLRG